MFAILRGANGRRHDVDFHDNPVTVAMSATTVQMTMTAAGSTDLSKCR